jgi:hypothetical protein
MHMPRTVAPRRMGRGSAARWQPALPVARQRGASYLTVSVPFIPACSWPGTEQ